MENNIEYINSYTQYETLLYEAWHVQFIDIQEYIFDDTLSMLICIHDFAPDNIHKSLVSYLNLYIKYKIDHEVDISSIDDYCETFMNELEYYGKFAINNLEFFSNIPDTNKFICYDQLFFYDNIVDDYSTNIKICGFQKIMNEIIFYIIITVPCNTPDHGDIYYASITLDISSGKILRYKNQHILQDNKELVCTELFTLEQYLLIYQISSNNDLSHNIATFICGNIASLFYDQ